MASRDIQYSNSAQIVSYIILSQTKLRENQKILWSLEAKLAKEGNGHNKEVLQCEKINSKNPLEPTTYESKSNQVHNSGRGIEESEKEGNEVTPRNTSLGLVRELSHDMVQPPSSSTNIMVCITQSAHL